MTENSYSNAENMDQEAVKYPIILYQNNSINAKPPYKVLRFENGVFMQLIDMHCRKFNSPAVSGGSYSVALFRMKEEEAELVQSRPERLDFLAKMLYEHIPADRFVRASVIRENKAYDIKISTDCQSIDGNAAEAASGAASEAETNACAEKAEPFKAAETEQPAQNIGRLDLRIVPDVLNDLQRETYVFAPVRAARCISAAELDGLSVTELVSVAFVTSKCNMSRMPQASLNAREENFRLLLGLIAQRLKNHSFFIIYDKTEESSVKLFNNGVPFTPVFSGRSAAESAVAGNDRMECVEISINKDDFFRQLIEKGIVQFIVDGNPLTLAVQGFYKYMSN